MNIVLEGPDNSGKSTLARVLSEKLQRPIYASEGPEKYPGELIERIERYRGLNNVIFDRHPCISDPIYGMFRSQRSSLAGGYEARFYAEQPLLIYCDPLDRGMQGHVEKKHDTAEHIDLIMRHHHAILNMYRLWAIQRSHFIFRIGDDVGRIVRLARDFDPVADVEAFHRRFNRDYDGAPRLLPPDVSQFREDFMREELTEYTLHARHAQAILEELNALINVNGYSLLTPVLAKMLDALVDEVYVVLGTARLHGFDFREAWRRVHEANMKKKGVERRIESSRYSSYDVVKPENWVAPDHTDLVSNHIHLGSRK